MSDEAPVERRAFGSAVLMERLAARLGCTPGQAYSLVILLAVGLVLGSLGLPAALRDRPASRLSSLPAPLDPAPRSTTTTTLPMSAAPGPLVVGVAPPPFVASPPSGATDDDAEEPSPAPRRDDEGSFGEVFAFASVPAPGAPSGVVAWGGHVDVSSDSGTQTRVFRYGDDGDLEKTFAKAAVPSGSARGISDLVVTADGALLGVAPAQAALLRLNPTSDDALVFGRIPDVGPCVVLAALAPCEPGVLDNAPLPVAAAGASNGDVYVADAGQATVWRFAAAGGTPTAVHNHLDYAVDGELGGIAVDGAGKLVLAATRSQAAGGGGALYVVDPASGERAELALTGADSAPAGLAIGRTGRVYVALRGAGRVLMLGPDGKEAARFPSAATAAWESPTDVAIRGQSILVTVQSPADAAKARVVRVAVGEGAAA